MPRKKILVDATGIVKTPTGLGKYSVYLLRSLLKNRNFQFSVFIQSNIAGNHPLRSLEKGNVHLISIDIPVIGPRREFVIYRMRESINNYHLYKVGAPDGTCISCHSTAIPNILPGHYGRIVKTDGNNMTAGDVIHCWSCHDYHDGEQ